MNYPTRKNTFLTFILIILNANYFQVETEGKPITNQKNSGRCWNFATLNVLRVPFIKQYNLEEFEFSQAYLFYWDKIERSYYFLNNIVDVAKRGEAVDGRLMAFLLNVGYLTFLFYKC